MKHFTAILTFISTLAFVLGPFLVPGFGGLDPNLYPIPQIDPPVQPAGYAFAIWGVIYLWLLISAGFGLLKRRDAEEWAPMRWPLIVSLSIGATWLFVAERSPVWAVILIFAMLATSLMALKRAPLPNALLARAPIGLYAGWLTGASFAGLGLLGAGYGIVFGETGWAYIGLIGAFGVAIAGHRMRPDAPLYPLGTAWALAAIAVQNWGSNWGIVIGAIAATLVLFRLSGRAYRRAVAQGARLAQKGRNSPAAVPDPLGRSRL
ncbi:hypothetical protein [Celeribacter sp.]|uniref:hypothetical protein n=1 Tax=Celeribacter sp. TaxID=1890673 RepID=UPI003A8E432A